MQRSVPVRTYLLLTAQWNDYWVRGSLASHGNVSIFSKAAPCYLNWASAASDFRLAPQWVWMLPRQRTHKAPFGEGATGWRKKEKVPDFFYFSNVFINWWLFEADKKILTFTLNLGANKARAELGIFSESRLEPSSAIYFMMAITYAMHHWVLVCACVFNT